MDIKKGLLVAPIFLVVVGCSSTSKSIVCEQVVDGNNYHVEITYKNDMVKTQTYTVKERVDSGSEFHYDDFKDSFASFYKDIHSTKYDISFQDNMLKWEVTIDYDKVTEADADKLALPFDDKTQKVKQSSKDLKKAFEEKGLTCK